MKTILKSLKASFPLLVVVVAAIVLAGCASTGDGSRVTPLPTGRRTATQPAQADASRTPVGETATSTPRDAAATPTPLQANLPAGAARGAAAATDIAFHPTPRQPVTFDTQPVALRFDEFYDGFNIRTGLTFSDKLVSLDGKEIRIEGYMAPPLKPALDFFVLTRIRLAFCPFCSTAADWPDDIALVYMPEDETTTATVEPVRVYGRLEVGASVDRETGMVSMVRIYLSKLEVIR